MHLRSKHLAFGLPSRPSPTDHFSNPRSQPSHTCQYTGHYIQNTAPLSTYSPSNMNRRKAQTSPQGCSCRLYEWATIFSSSKLVNVQVPNLPSTNRLNLKPAPRPASVGKHPPNRTLFKDQERGGSNFRVAGRFEHSH